MNIWLIAEGEPLPIEGQSRLMRVGMLAEYLARQGHNVTWYSSTFVHGRKEYLYRKTTEIMVREHERLILLHAPIAYKKNTSFTRVIYMELLGRAFRQHAHHEEKPDIVYASWPLPSFGEEAVRYGRKHNVPVVLDVRDFWPDIFTRAFPQGLRWASKLALQPMQRAARRSFRQADAVTGMVPAALRWGLHKAGRSARALDQVIYIGYDDSRDLPDEVMRKEIARWGNLGVTPETYNIIFFGSMSAAVIDGGTCIAGFKKLVQKYPDMRLVLCGDGDGLSRNKALAAGCPQIVFPGWCDNAQIQSLLSISNAGLYPMHNLPDFRDTISNKFIGYLAAGLPVISELEGFSKTYIERWQIGTTYQENQPDSFAQAAESLYLDRETAQRLGQNARKRFEADFDAEIVNEKFLRLFEELA